jgi:hypothetical protein
MNVRIPRFAPARAGLLGVLAMGALVAACETALPTAAEVQHMDVRAAETRAAQFQMVADSARMIFIVDGKHVSAEEARALSAGRIARIAITRRKGDSTGTYTVTTGESFVGGTAHTRDFSFRRGDSVPGITRLDVEGRNPRGSFGPVTLRSGESFAGLLVVDGRITDPSAMRTIEPGSIDNIEVIKGGAAARLYPNEPRAVHGVIRITTKAGARR